MTGKASTHRLVGPDGVQEGKVVISADFRQDEGQKAAVAIQLGVHEILKVEQVCDDVHGCVDTKTETRHNMFTDVLFNSSREHAPVWKTIIQATSLWKVRFRSSWRAAVRLQH